MELAVGIGGKGVGRGYQLGSGQDKDGIYRVILEEPTQGMWEHQKAVQALGHTSGKRSGTRRKRRLRTASRLRRRKTKRRTFKVFQESF